MQYMHFSLNSTYIWTFIHKDSCDLPRANFGVPRYVQICIRMCVPMSVCLSAVACFTTVLWQVSWEAYMPPQLCVTPSLCVTVGVAVTVCL